MKHSVNHSRRVWRYTLYVPACLAACVACSEDTGTGPEGSSSGDTSNSSSTATASSSASSSTTNTSTNTVSGTSSRAETSTGASGQSGTSTGASGQSGTSTGPSGQSGTSSGGSGQSGTSSGGSGTSTSGASDGSNSTSVDSAGSSTSADSNSSSDTSDGGDEFSLTSAAHMEGAEFDDKYTCEGKSFFDMVIPPLQWSNPPAGTMSYAITFVDTFILEDDTIDDMLGYHWAMLDIPTDVTSIAEGMEAAVTGARRIGGQGGAFFGPCPDGREDTYAFTIHAIPTATLSYQGNSVAQAVAAIETASLGSAVLTGVSSASPL
jgi:phosphatidylethanolamine-binding protein (PEBP) family uncharacterized protein